MSVTEGLGKAEGEVNYTFQVPMDDVVPVQMTEAASDSN